MKPAANLFASALATLGSGFLFYGSSKKQILLFLIKVGCKIYGLALVNTR
jgi:hypothetical protein